MEEGTLEELIEKEEQEDIQDAHEAGSGRSRRQTDVPSTSSKNGGSTKYCYFFTFLHLFLLPELISASQKWRS